MLPLDPLEAASRAVQLARSGRFVHLQDGPMGDLELDALAEGLPAWLAKREGYLYVAANPTTPDLYKIGCTRRTVAERMRSLNGPGTLAPWTPVLVWKVYDAHGLEALAHKACAAFRVEGAVASELFQAPWQELAACIEASLASDKSALIARISPLSTFCLELPTVRQVQ